MLKNHPKRFSFLFLFISVIVSCGKDPGSKNAETYIVSAKKIIDMTGKDWYEVEPQLKDKKGYWYTEFPQDQISGLKAAVSLPAIDDSNSNINCHALFLFCSNET